MVLDRNVFFWGILGTCSTTGNLVAGGGSAHLVLPPVPGRAAARFGGGPRGGVHSVALLSE